MISPGICGALVVQIVAEELLHSGQVDTLLQGGRGEGGTGDVRGHVLGQTRLIGDLFVQILGKVVLLQRPHPAGHRQDADLGPLAIGTSVAPDVERPLLPEDALGVQNAELADAVAGVA